MTLLFNSVIRSKWSATSAALFVRYTEGEITVEWLRKVFAEGLPAFKLLKYSTYSVSYLK